MPIAAITASNPPMDLKSPTENRSSLSQSEDFERIGAFEGIVTQIDPEGSVRNAIGSFQNASYYGITYTADYQAAAEGQMATGTGYVAAAQLEIAGRAVYPTGRIGDAFAMLTLIVNPIIVLPAAPASWYLSEPTLAEAQELADEFVAIYETDLLIEFTRLTTYRQYVSISFNSSYTTGDGYLLQYVSFPDETDADTAMGNMRTRLGELGGFMDLLDGTGWPLERTSFAETIFFSHSSEESWYYTPPYYNPLYMYPSVMYAYVRADASFPDYIETVQTGILGVAGFDEPDYITDGAGDETYSLKQHIGYTGDIESKMFQDTTMNSISSIVAVTPSHLEFSGIPTDWDTVGKDWRMNGTGDFYLPTGGTISANSTAEEIIHAMTVSYPFAFATMLNMSISTLNPNMFDYFIDNLWMSPGPFPDLREEILDFDWSMVFTGFPFEELNQDALRMIMEQAGITPDSLMSKVNETLIEENPMQALIEAFISTVDSYHLLDILENTTYSNPYVLEGFLNDYIEDIGIFIANFTGVELPSSYATKEAFAALIEDHFGLVLQGLWDAMADFTGDTTNIKTAVQAMIDPEHLAIETVPYFMADMYSAMISEYDYKMAVNFELPIMGASEPWEPALLWISADDIVLTFDLDLSTMDFSGPHCTIRKSVPQVMKLGSNVTVTITVENIGDAAAYDLKILDGVTTGFNTDKQYYWNRASLAAGATWEVTCSYSPESIGTFVEVPAILCYFNATLASFAPDDMENWGGSARYTISAVFADRRVDVAQWWEEDLFGIPMTIIIAGGIGAAIIVIIIIVKKRA